VQHSLRVAVTDIERSGNGVRQLFLTFSANRVVSPSQPLRSTGSA
jgi:hypothetical protein